MSSTHVYEESGLDFPEDLEQYKPGGFHPLALKQIVGGGRFQIVHKLGSGAMGTVWLVRDLASGATDGSRLFCLKVVQADRSPMCAEDAAEVAIPKALAASSAELRERLLVAIESFLEVGPNGSHLCTISAVAGPSLSSMHECPGRVIGNRRLRAEYSRKIARQVAGFVQGMHSMGYAHGGVCCSTNVAGALLTST
jgi:serine/threonine-protein kinase SRPK3